uniref:Reverse transcriptase zinc-binding domain-containing protein n=1 Tax=Cannabis sativa TaxID=3483 RepID=A0A803PZR8_CANSA
MPVKFKVGKGDKIRFCEDEWLGDSSLLHAYPGLALISRAKNVSIIDLVAEGGAAGESVVSWDFKFRRNLLEREIPSLIGMLQQLEHVKLLNVNVDIRIWKPDATGVFSSKSAFAWFNSNQNGARPPWTKSLWKSTAMSRVKIFIWLVAHGKVNVHDVLQRRRPFILISPGWCVSCKSSGEEVEHLFLHCKFSSKLWSMLLEEFGLIWALPRSVPQMLVSKIKGSKRQDILWKTAVLATIWAIWLERNTRIFEDVENSLQSGAGQNKITTRTWVFRTKHFEDLSFLDLSREWRVLL